MVLSEIFSVSTITILFFNQRLQLDSQKTYVLAKGMGISINFWYYINNQFPSYFCSQVSRTKDRPLVQGQISQLDALVFLGGQLGVGLLILLQLNLYSIVLGASSLGMDKWNHLPMVLKIPFKIHDPKLNHTIEG